ncbi:MAG: DUF4336 domain-containing protein [Rhodospirillales bacterium]|nr:DUF4336 domain-containing protein [Rhodospirillales bacterium]
MVFKLETYEPLNTLKPITNNIWVVDGPIISFKAVPFTTRMTIIRLASGELFIHSPTRLTSSLKAEIIALGKVRYLISPNKIHYWWIGEWGNHFPEALKFASPGVQPLAKKQGWEFNQDLGEQPDKAWEDEIDQIIVRGGRYLDEVVFFHQASQTLILTDLIENFEPHKIHSWFMRFLTRIGKNSAPDGCTPRDLQLTYWGRHKEILPAVEQMIAWHPERIILSHGKWFERDGVSELYRAFRWVKGLPPKPE